MNDSGTTGHTQSIWMATSQIPERGPLTSNTRTDVCVVGAGISGLTTAYLLAKAGKKVVVLDAGSVAGGETARTSAHLASATDDRFFEIERLHGLQGAKFAYGSHAAAIDEIEAIAKREKIDCEFARLDAYLGMAPEHDVKLLERELEAAHRAGFHDAELIDQPALSGYTLGPCIRFPRQARFHPLKYLAGIVQALERMGVRIYGQTLVKDVQGGDTTKGETPHATAENGSTVSADAIVVCCNVPAPINDWMGIYLKQSSYRTFVVAMTIPRGAMADILYWDTADPYHYVRVESGADGNDVLLVGGADHKVGQAPEQGAPFLELETWARKNFPAVGSTVYRWSGQVQEPIDGVAYIGRALTAKPNVYCCTGDSGMGLTHGTIAGMLITDQIMGRPNPWEALYDPSRRTLKAAGEFTRETANVAAQYAALVTPGEVASVDDIRPGSSAILREGLSKLAVYRDEDGQVHRKSALCTHLGCVVQWNNIEKSWDCPCHGSRFAADGKPVMGPAIDPLAEVEDKAK